jgi:hypothetical protein
VHAAKDLLGSGHRYVDVRWDRRYYFYHFDGEFYGVIIKVIHVLLLCLFKNEVAFKIII